MLVMAAILIGATGSATLLLALWLPPPPAPTAAAADDGDSSEPSIEFGTTAEFEDSEENPDE
jgi:hypothetical protein